MKQLLSAEQAAQLALAIFAISLQPISIAWWLWPFAFLAPDLAMLGYLVNTKIGAWTYNIVHHKAIATTIIVAGYFMHIDWLLLTGLILFAHSAFDRMLGYGLKYEDSFKHTHLGVMSKEGRQSAELSTQS
jgi:hypothetical protein